MRVLFVAVAVSALFTVAGCGNDNVAACEDYVNKVTECGDDTLSATYHDSWCETYEDLDCDISEFFDCMSEAIGECEDGGFPNADASAISACASKAVCE
jgi:hypothetical protein